MLHSKTTSIHLVALLTLASTVSAQTNWRAPRIVANYCSGCHGVDGNSQLPYMPKLAGLDAQYAEKKMHVFKEPSSPPVDEAYWWILKTMGSRKESGNGTRAERINMEGVAHAAKPDVIHEAVAWYAKQMPAKGHAASGPLIQKGQELFTKGAPAQKVLPCVTCHGADAQGQGPAPRLAGQNAEYTEGQLDKFRKGDRSHSPEMTMVTRDLDAEQAHAVALYLQSK